MIRHSVDAAVLAAKFVELPQWLSPLKPCANVHFPATLLCNAAHGHDRANVAKVGASPVPLPCLKVSGAKFKGHYEASIACFQQGYNNNNHNERREGREKKGGGGGIRVV